MRNINQIMNLAQEISPLFLSYLRRYKRRHKVENYFADLQTFRRVIIRYERKSENYLTFVKLAAICLNFWKFNIGMKIVA